MEKKRAIRMKRYTRAVLFLLMIILLTGCAYYQGQKSTPTPSIGITSVHPSSVESTSTSSNKTTMTPVLSPSLVNSPPPTNTAGTISVHFINVGKADSILINTGTSAMLIDAGTPDMADTVVNYLKAHGITKLDYIIATHSHVDHIGGMAAVLNTFPVNEFLMPDVPDTSVIYKNLLHTLTVCKIKRILPKVGGQYHLGTAKFTILAPNGTGYKSINDYSIVIRLVFGNTSFLFTGDVLKTSEKEILANNLTLSSTLLKVAHHRGGSSSTIEFLRAVQPKYAVISVETTKKGFPSDKTLQRLASLGIEVFRTDEAGSIIATSNGQTISLDKNPSIIVLKPTKH